MFKKILVPLDRSSFAEQALGLAAVIARASNAHVDLVLIHEPRPLAGTPDVAWHLKQVEAENQYLSDFGDELMKCGSIPTSHAVLVGDVVSLICERAVAIGADMIVMTSHGRTGLIRSWIGSIADGVLRNSGIPVLLWRATDSAGNPVLPFTPIRQILVPFDGSAIANEILDSTADLARCTGARVCILRVVQPAQLLAVETAIPFAMPFPADDTVTTARATEWVTKDLAETARVLCEKTNVQADTHVIVARDVGKAIVDFALEGRYDAVAMSTHGRGASRLIFGSVADKVIRSAGLPMLLRRPTIATGARGDVGKSHRRKALSH